MKTVNLDVYRSCSFKEKRDVLNAFWRSTSHASPRIMAAALQYGFWAVVCLGVVVVEIALILGVLIARGSVVLWPSAVVELLVILSTWWSVVRYRFLKARATT